MTVSVSVFPNSLIRKMVLTGQSPTSVPLIIKGASAQTEDLQKWQNSSGVTLAKIRNDGLIAAPYFRDTTDTGPYFLMGNTQIWAVSAGVAHNPLIVAGIAGQTGDLQRWQDSTPTVQGRITAAGGLCLGSAAVSSPSGWATFGDVTITGSTGISWYGSGGTSYGIYKTAEAWSAPDYSQLKLSFQTGIQLDPGALAYGKSFVDILNGGLRVTAPAAAATLTAADRSAVRFTNPSLTTLAFSAPVGAPNGWTLQVRHATIDNIAYPLLLNPLGGLVGVGLLTQPQGTLHVRTNAVGTHCQVIESIASQTADELSWWDGTTVQGRINKAGYIITAKKTAPADADVNTSEVALWWDDRSGQPNIVFKGKDSAGTVKTYSPSRLLASTKYTAAGTSAVRTTQADVGITTASFTMPTLLTGQKIEVVVTGYYYNFATSIAANLSLYQAILANAVQICAKHIFTFASTTQVFTDVTAYFDNTDIAAGTAVVVKVQGLTTSGTAYQFFAGTTSPVYITCKIV